MRSAAGLLHAGPWSAAQLNAQWQASAERDAPLALDIDGQRLVLGLSLARYLAKRGGGAASASARQSPRNRRPGIVTRVVKDRVAAQVEIQVGPHRVVSLLTSEAADTLGLAPGMLAIATVKATFVDRGLPANFDEQLADKLAAVDTASDTQVWS